MNLLPTAGDIAQQITERISTSDQLPGLEIGLGDFDALMGFRPGDLVLLSGDHGSGKTGLALSIARKVAIGSNVGVLIFSPTKSADYLVSQILISEVEGGTNGDVRLTNAESERLKRLQVAQQGLESVPIWIYDQSYTSFEDISRFADGLKKKVGLILIDDISDIRDSHGVITDKLKGLAEQLHLPILAVCPLGSGTDSQEDRRPILDNLDASHVMSPDMVLFTYCPSMYGLRSPHGAALDGILEVIVAKNRYNAEGSVFLHIDTVTSDCRDLAPEWSADD